MLLRLASRLVRPLALTTLGLVVVWCAWSLVKQRVAVRIGASASRGEIPAGPATRALHAMRDEATATLVRLATAPEPHLSQPARTALAARVDGWRRDAPDNTRRFTKRVERLLSALDHVGPSLTRSTKGWANRFTTSLLADVSLVRPTKRAELFTRIDGITHKIAEAKLAPDPPPRIVQEEPPPEVATTVAEAVDLPPPPDEFLPSEVAIAKLAPPPPRQAVTPIDDQPSWDPEWGAPTEPQPLVAEPSQPLAPSPATPSKAVKALPRAEPTDRELLAALLAAADRRPATPIAQGPRSARDRYGDLDPETKRISQALYERGYRGVSLHHVRSLLSDNPRERAQLVEKLLLDSSGETAKLILLLAYDEDAQVRAAAVSALAASPRRELVEASWEIAVRDPDPRVGRLAESIGERLR